MIQCLFEFRMKIENNDFESAIIISIRTLDVIGNVHIYVWACSWSVFEFSVSVNKTHSINFIWVFVPTFVKLCVCVCTSRVYRCVEVLLWESINIWNPTQYIFRRYLLLLLFFLWLSVYRKGNTYIQLICHCLPQNSLISSAIQHTIKIELDHESYGLWRQQTFDKCWPIQIALSF